MIDAILQEAEILADSRNHEVLERLMTSLSRPLQICLHREEYCRYCDCKFEYVANKIAAGRCKRFLMHAATLDEVSWLKNQRELSEIAMHCARRAMNECQCGCNGVLWKEREYEVGIYGWAIKKEVERMDDRYKEAEQKRQCIGFDL